MWIRSAFWTGNIKAGQEAAFRQGIDTEMIPGLQRLAGVKVAKALWPHRYEDKAPKHACIVLVEFDSFEAIEHMLASPERAALRKQALRLVEMFDGTLTHIDCEVG